MKHYVESCIMRDEVLVKKADKNPVVLVGTWLAVVIIAVLELFAIKFIKAKFSLEDKIYFYIYIGCAVLLLIFIIKAIVSTVGFLNIEIAITDKRFIGKSGVLNIYSIDMPLNKVQSVVVLQSWMGKIFNYSIVKIITASSCYRYKAIRNGDDFKNMTMSQVAYVEEARSRREAELLAVAIAGELKKNGKSADDAE